MSSASLTLQLTLTAKADDGEDAKDMVQDFGVWLIQNVESLRDMYCDESGLDDEDHALRISE